MSDGVAARVGGRRRLAASALPSPGLSSSSWVFTGNWLVSLQRVLLAATVSGWFAATRRGLLRSRCRRCGGRGGGGGGGEEGGRGREVEGIGACVGGERGGVCRSGGGGSGVTRRGIEPVVLEPGRDLVQLAEDVADRGADVIGMAGGDGSQAVVASVAIRHEVAFVCVPAGTRTRSISVRPRRLGRGTRRIR